MPDSEGRPNTAQEAFDNLFGRVRLLEEALGLTSADQGLTLRWIGDTEINEPNRLTLKWIDEVA